jgi:hypothetical protein
MEVQKTRFDDEEPGEYSYHGHGYKLIFDSWILGAKVYDDEPKRVSFLLSEPQKNSPHFKEVLEYFQREIGAEEVRFTLHAPKPITMPMAQLLSDLR